jgi:hypothetical protein
VNGTPSLAVSSLAQGQWKRGSGELERVPSPHAPAHESRLVEHANSSPRRLGQTRKPRLGMLQAFLQERSPEAENPPGALEESVPEHIAPAGTAASRPVSVDGLRLDSSPVQ